MCSRPTSPRVATVMLRKICSEKLISLGLEILVLLSEADIPILLHYYQITCITCKRLQRFRSVFFAI